MSAEEATSNAADLTPAEIPMFQAQNPAEFRALLAEIAGLDRAAELAPQLAPYTSNAAMRARASWDPLLDSFAHYFLTADLRPDDTLTWDGAQDDPTLLGALLTGARFAISSPG